MMLLLPTLFSLSSLAPPPAPVPSQGQTEALVHFSRPGGPLHGWGDALVDIGDLDGDGAHDLAVGRLAHGGGELATVHSGRTGRLLYRLQAPATPAFFGDAIVPLVDESGDGLPELAAIGSQSGASGSPDGMLLIYSGADGSLLRQVGPPAGFSLKAHTQGDAYSPGDVDGDGFGDILTKVSPHGGGTLAWALLSGADGQPLYVVLPLPGGAFIGNLIARMSDHDGDGQDDFAVPVRAGSQTTWVEVRSGATGALIAQLDVPGTEVLTGNGEPFISIADLDGDGLRDLAFGNILGSVGAGSVALHSSATGALLRRWDCETQPVACFGSRLIEVGDMTGDRRPDLIALESNAFGSKGLRMFGLDPTRKEPIFEELVLGLFSGYASNTDRLVALPGIDPDGFPSFALFEDLDERVGLWRHRPHFAIR